MKLLHGAVGLAAIALTTGAAFSQTARESGLSESITRGATIASLGNGRGAGACASCHAFNGAADPSGAFPRLAGQSAIYLRRSLDSYAEGGRQNVIMGSIARALSQQERADVASYFAFVYAPIPPTAPVGSELLEQGRALATVGVNDQQLVACSTCHGPYGRSVTPTTPSLGGQYARYVSSQLRMFRDGRRSTGAAAMAGFAHALTDSQVEAVASYFQRAPGPTGPLPPGNQGVLR